MSIRQHFHETTRQMFAELTNRITTKLAESVACRGTASLLLSGGSTPIPLFDRLSEFDLDWSKVTVTLVDERWVDADNPDSNERLLREHLLKNKAVEARLVPMKNAHKTPEAGQSELESALNDIVRPYDVVLLGMGNDGHTASLFPGGDQLNHALTTDELCCSMRAPGAPQARMTFTLSALLQCRDLILLCTGTSKQDTFKKALESGPTEEMPIRAFLRQERIPIAFYWAP